ncbi:hypothetical protein [Paraburkholderia phosphatilytica]|uniref:hypothetical protein n=1 Tax=Paraburkholderia phosphatilytica TaxID=2282883 RepID=UPI000E544354|nr:hypothetical protein [Paraburkholderia phosphatilytica]
MDSILDERNEAQSCTDQLRSCRPSLDALPRLSVDGCRVFYDGELIHEAVSHEEAIVYRDRLIDIYT